jgi:23S rRNA (guanosine2251-2'-O)-methyltransferase
VSEETVDPQRYVVGRRAVAEALESGAALEKVFIAYTVEEGGALSLLRTAARNRGVQCSTMDRRKFGALERQLGCAPNDAQGVIAIRPVRDAITLEALLIQARASSEEPIVVVLDGITDPHNLGAIARSAEAVGAAGIVLPIKYSAPITPVAVKASAGALEHLPIAKVPRVSEALKYCRSQGWRVVGTAIPASAVYSDDVYSGPLVIVIGNEGEGLHPSVKAVCDALVEIPMLGHVQSLNASVAAGIVLFAAASRRRGA